MWLRSRGWNHFFPANESIIGRFDDPSDARHPLEAAAGQFPPYVGPDDETWRHTLRARAGLHTNDAIAKDAWNWMAWDRHRANAPFDVEGRPGDGLRVFTSAIRFSTPTWLPSAVHVMHKSTWLPLLHSPLRSVFEQLGIKEADLSVQLPASTCHKMPPSLSPDAVSVISSCASPNSNRSVWCIRRCVLRSNLDTALNRPQQASLSSVVLPEEVLHKLVSPLLETNLLSIVKPGLQEFRLEFAQGKPEQWLAFSESERVRKDNVYKFDNKKYAIQAHRETDRNLL